MRRRQQRRRAAAAPALSVRSQLLMGAAEVFGTNGFADTSVEDVLRAAGVSRRTFYRFFRNKEELFDELAEAAAMMFLSLIQNAAALGKTPVDKLANCIEVYLRAPETAGPIFRVLQVESARPGSRHAARRQIIIDKLIELLADGIREEQGREVEPLMLRGLIGAVEAISLHVHETGSGDEETIQRAKTAMLEIMGRALAMPEGG